MPREKIIYGSWKNGAAIFKDRKGYFIFDWDEKIKKEFKKYLPKWKPKSDEDKIFFNEKKKRWQLTKLTKQK